MILADVYHNIIASCQALPAEPLYSSFIMGRMAYAAQEGGAKAIRANSINDIQSIQKTTHLPIIGLIKRNYPQSDVYITPTLKEIKLLAEVGVNVIATDFTGRKRPKESIEEIISYLRSNYPDILIMGDTASPADVDDAVRLGIDIIGTTMSGYTPETKGISLPNIDLVRYAAKSNIPVFCEGGIKTIADVNTAFAAGAHACVIGGAISRPKEITENFVTHIHI